MAFSILFFFSYDHPHILAGAGACALEIIDQVQDIDAVVIPIGGGGLIAGCAVAFKALNPNIEVIVGFFDIQSNSFPHSIPVDTRC